jgi:hypothetical protein
VGIGAFWRRPGIGLWRLFPVTRMLTAASICHLCDGFELVDVEHASDLRFVVADKLAIATDARAKGRTAEDAARLVGQSRALSARVRTC